MAQLIHVDGRIENVSPKTGTAFTLEELQGFVGGYIEHLDITRPMTGDKVHMILNEEGKLNGLPVNPIATQITRGIVADDDLIVGDVLVLNDKEMGE